MSEELGIQTKRLLRCSMVLLLSWIIVTGPSTSVELLPCRFLDGGGIIGDIVHSHILQTIALLAMEPPISLDGEAIRNEKVNIDFSRNFDCMVQCKWIGSFQVKLLRSIRPLEPSDVVLGQYKSNTKDKVDLFLDNLTPTYFAGALYIDNARWDGVPFLIKSGLGLIKHW